MNKLHFTLAAILLLGVCGTILFKTKEQKQVTLREYRKCYHDYSQYPDSCQYDMDFLLTLNKFNNITIQYYDQKPISKYCLKYDALNGGPLNQLNNYKNYFSKCYHTSEIKALAKTNECFELYFYKPIYYACAGF